MKKFKILTAFFVLIGFIACDDQNSPINNIYDNDGQTGVGFTTANSSVVVRDTGGTATVSVQSTTTSSADRSFNVSVNDELSDGNPGDYTIGSIVIPAGEYNGELEVSFVDTNLEEMVAYTLVLDLELPDGVAAHSGKSTTISYNKYLICNDLTLVLNEDNYADERDWAITVQGDPMNIVLQCSDYADCPGGAASGFWDPAQYVYEFYLDDGDYTFTIYDTFADGQYDNSITGNYSLTCSIINIAYGEGSWGGSVSHDFTVNP